MWRTGWSILTRTVSATKLIAQDARVPRPLRWIAAIGLLPLPGPIDEALLLLIAPVLVIFYRDPMREAWERAGRDSRGPSRGRVVSVSSEGKSGA